MKCKAELGFWVLPKTSHGVAKISWCCKKYPGVAKNGCSCIWNVASVDLHDIRWACSWVELTQYFNLSIYISSKLRTAKQIGERMLSSYWLFASFHIFAAGASSRLHLPSAGLNCVTQDELAPFHSTFKNVYTIFSPNNIFDARIWNLHLILKQ